MLWLSNATGEDINTFISCIATQQLQYCIFPDSSLLISSLSCMRKLNTETGKHYELSSFLGIVWLSGS